MRSSSDNTGKGQSALPFISALAAEVGIVPSYVDMTGSEIVTPDGTRIAYYGISGDNSDVYILDAGGGQPYQLTTAAETEQWPDWSPDGLRITYTSAVGQPEGKRAVFVLDLAGGEPLQLTPGEGRDDDPVWSLDGTRIAFDSDRNGNKFDLFIFDVATGTMQQLTSNAGDNVAPAWQP